MNDKRKEEEKAQHVLDLVSDFALLGLKYVEKLSLGDFFVTLTHMTITMLIENAEDLEKALKLLRDVSTSSMQKALNDRLEKDTGLSSLKTEDRSKKE